MEKQKVNNPDEPSNHSFTMVPDFFYRRLIKVMGAIPSLLYLALLSYCHRKRYLAWPSLNTMSKEMGMAKTTIIRNLNILIKLKVIKNIAQGQSDKNHYHHNIYQILPPEKILLSLSDKKNKDGGGSETIPVGFQHATESGSEMIPHVVAERYPKHNHLNNNNITTTKEGAVAAVNCKKLKEKGEEKMRAIRERMVELDFKEAFIEKMLKDFSMKKVEEKLDLLRERRNIQSPAGWLMAALKNDYQDVEEPSRITPHPHLGPPPSRGRKFNVIANDRRERGNLVSTPEQVSREKALEAIRLIQKNISNCTSVRKDPYPLSPGGRGLG